MWGAKQTENNFVFDGQPYICCYDTENCEKTVAIKARFTFEWIEPMHIHYTFLFEFVWCLFSSARYLFSWNRNVRRTGNQSSFDYKQIVYIYHDCTMDSWPSKAMKIVFLPEHQFHVYCQQIWFIRCFR